MITFLRENFFHLLIPFAVLIALGGLGIVGWVRRRYQADPKGMQARISALSPHIRRDIYIFSAIIATISPFWITWSVPSSGVAILLTQRWFAFVALIFLFSVYVPTLFLVYAPGFPINGLMVRARRALGISAFFFGCVHGAIGFFVTFHGSINSIIRLDARYFWAIMLAVVAATLLTLMAMTSFDVIQQKMGKWWKRLHRFVYVATFFVLLHAWLIGSHFTGSGSVIPLTILGIAFALMLLKVGEQWKKLQGKKGVVAPLVRFLGFCFLIAVVLVSLYLFVLAVGQTGGHA